LTTRIPLAEASGDEILARVTYQLILLDYHDNPDKYDHPEVRLFELAYQWRLIGLAPIHEQLELAAIWCSHGSRIADWLKSRIMVSSGRAPILARLGRTRGR
jgi:hypothetical protein